VRKYSSRGRTDRGPRSDRTGPLPRVSRVKMMTGPRMNGMDRSDRANGESVHAVPD
jgi:hypothetical protein